MCGIAGLFLLDGKPVDRAVLDRMTDALAHRGPDGRGVHVDGSLGLGHRRLSIIDLSADGAQPMSNEDGTVWVTLNGEIYNFQALRDELIAKGHRFRSRTDTEVLVHLYEEVGDDLVLRLRGMFAFAIWDARRRRVLLARDRFGKKPLYYRLTRDALHFGSEIKAILEDPAVQRVPDPIALSDYLTYGYVPAPLTAFQGIKKLPAAHTLAIEGSAPAQPRRYWSLPLGPKRRVEATPADEGRVLDELLGVLDEATRLRMISDVPLGAFLSGGVDSSAVVASMVEASKRAGGGASGVRTFSIGFDEPAWDESRYAKLVADHLHTRHEALTLRPDAWEGLERIAWHHGEPFADSSCLPTFAVSRLARQRVTVALSGDGGDELFCGYHRYVGTRLEERVRLAPRPLRALARNRALIHLLHKAPWLGSWAGLAGDLAHNAWHPDTPAADLYLTRIEQLGPAQKRELMSDGWRDATRGRDSRDLVRRLIATSSGETFSERCAHADTLSYLPDDILVKVDVASMAYGLETRAPLLDQELAELVGRLPFRLKMARLETKLALKRAVAPRLPAETISRRKMGFGVPLDAWFRGGLKAALEDTLLAPRARERGLLRPDVIRRLIDEHARGATNHQNVLFTLLMLETWHRQWIDPPQGAPVPRAAVAPVATAAPASAGRAAAAVS